MKKLMIPLVALCLCPVGCGNSKTAEEAAQDGDIPALKRMAENGNAEAQYHLGDAYNDGWEEEQDYKEAAKWWRKAAEQGFNIPDDRGMALFDPAHWISVIYEEGGYGLKQDLVAAYAWCTIAATNNRGTTSNGFRLRKRLRELAEKMTPEQISKGQKLSSEMVKKQRS